MESPPVSFLKIQPLHSGLTVRGFQKHPLPPPTSQYPKLHGLPSLTLHTY